MILEKRILHLAVVGVFANSRSYMVRGKIHKLSDPDMYLTLQDPKNKFITMRKIILEVAVSHDGFIEGPNGEYDWCFRDQDYGLSDFFKRVDSIFMGSRSYEIMQAMSESDSIGFPKLKEFIFSTTLDKVKEGAVLLKNNIEEEAKKSRVRKGKISGFLVERDLRHLF